jgi:hypothetical protein
LKYGDQPWHAETILHAMALLILQYETTMRTMPLATAMVFPERK